MRPSKLELWANAYPANVQVHIGSRGTAKSSGGIPAAMVRRSKEMPRSNHAFHSTTYVDAMLNTLPAVVEGLNRMGYIEGQNLFVKCKPHKQWLNRNAIAMPYRKPQSDHNSIYLVDYKTQTATLFQITSQDRPVRSQSNDGIIVDEGLLIKEEKLKQDMLPTLRGHEEYYKGNPWHYCMQIFSSMPWKPGTSWLLDYGKYYKDDGVANARHWQRISDLICQLADARSVEAGRAIYRQLVEEKKAVRHYVHTQRSAIGKQTLFYAQYDPIDNINNLGIKYLRRQRSELPDIKFRIEVANQRLKKVEGGFYPALGEIHLYEDQVRYGYVDGRIDAGGSQVRDSRWDGDCDPNKELIIGQDFGTFVGIVVCQTHMHQGAIEHRVLKNIYVWQKVLDEAVEQFCQYYKHHKRKVVHYHHDANGNVTLANSRLTMVDQAVGILRQHGWTVHVHTTTTNPSHMLKYEMWNHILAERDNDTPRLRINEAQAADTYTSMANALIKAKGQEDFEKDKRSEHKPIPQQEATHLSDALDYVMWWYYSHLSGDASTFSGSALIA